MAEWYQPGQIRLEQQNIQQNAFALQQQQQAMRDQMELRNAIMRNRPQAPQMVSSEENLGSQEMTAQYPPVSASPVEQARKEIQGDDYTQPQGPVTTKSVNKMVQPEVPEPQSIYDVQARQFWDTQQMEQYKQYASVQGPALKEAYESGNDQFREAFVKQNEAMFEKTGNPLFKQTADTYKNVSFTSDGFTFDGPINDGMKAYAMKMAKNPGQAEAVQQMQPGEFWTLKGDRKGGIEVKQSKDKEAVKGSAKTTESDLQKQTPEELEQYLLRNSKNMTPAAVESLKSIIAAGKRRKGNERATDVKLAVDDEGKIQGVKVAYAPAPTKISVNVSGAGGDGPTGKVGQFPDSAYERYYAAGEKRDALPIPLQSFRTANQKAQANFQAGYDEWMKRTGKAAGDIAEHRGDIKADTTNLGKLRTASGATNVFIKTMDNNIDMWKQHVEKEMKDSGLDRAAFLNRPIRWFEGNVLGKSKIKIYDMLVNALAAENAKLQNGGAGSVAQVAEGARAEAKRIHDNNMPIGEMLKLLESTRKEGGGRQRAYDSEISDVQGRLKGSKKSGAPNKDEYIKHWKSKYPNKSNKELEDAYNRQFGGA